MRNYHIDFSLSPYILILILPILVIIWLAFFIERKRSRSRVTVNRVIASILQSAVAVLLVFALSGIHATYEMTDPENELIILVDRSYTADKAQEDIDAFIEDIFEINEERYDIGIIAFGYDQVVALPTGKYSAKTALDTYHQNLAVHEVDTSATDIAGALRCAYNARAIYSSVIKRPESAEVLILSDGLQTDQDAISEAKNLMIEGITVNTAFYPTVRDGQDASFVGVTLSDHALMQDEDFEMKLNFLNSYNIMATIKIEDKDEYGNVREKEVPNTALVFGPQTVTVPYVFETDGIHELKFSLQAEGDAVEENNTWNTYYNVTGHHRVLVVETYQGESGMVETLISQNFNAETVLVDKLNVSDFIGLTLEDLAKYSELILYNTSQNDLPAKFQQLLYTYTHDLGGGMFTVGGFEKDAGGNIKYQPKPTNPDKTMPVPYSYREDDPTNSAYAQMLPVTFEPYEPGVGVVFVVDVSASMYPMTKKRIGAECTRALDLLQPKDYVGLVYIADSYSSVEQMTPMTNREDLEERFANVRYAQGGGTYYAPGLQHAVDMLKTLPATVTRRHIVLMSDAGPADRIEQFGSVMKEAHDTMGITITVAQYYVEKDDKGNYYSDNLIGHFNPAYREDTRAMLQLADAGGGEVVYIQQGRGWSDAPFTEAQLQPFYEALERGLNLDSLTDVDSSGYSPTMQGNSAVLDDITATDLNSLTLRGYFPSREKLHGDVETSLLAQGSPLYSEWEYGKGRVGSLMIDLEAQWSADLLTKPAGIKVVSNIVSHLFQTVEEIRYSIDMEVVEDNYRTQVNVYGFDPEEERDSKLVALIKSSTEAGEEIQRFDLSILSSTQNRFTFDNRNPGTYLITVMKVSVNYDVNRDDNSEDLVFETISARRSFSYSKEYSQTTNSYLEGRQLMLDLSSKEVGENESPDEKFVYDAESVFGDYKVIHVIIDPRMALLITAMILYIIGVIVRKFKIKLPKRKSERIHVTA